MACPGPEVLSDTKSQILGLPDAQLTRLATKLFCPPTIAETHEENILFSCPQVARP